MALAVIFLEADCTFSKGKLISPKRARPWPGEQNCVESLGFVNKVPKFLAFLYLRQCVRTS